MWLAYFQSYLENNFPKLLKENVWNYKHGLCLAGASCLAQASGDGRWNQYITGSGRWLMEEDGTVVNWKEGEHNLDKISFGSSLWLLYRLTGDIRYQKAAKKIYGSLASYPRTETGNFWHKDIYPNQVWLDGFYMAMPFYARMLEETGEDRWDDIAGQFQSAHRLLWDGTLRLHVHGCDVSRKAKWADPVTGKSPAVWLRAEGWYLMALADVYELARGKTARAGELAALLKKSLDGLLSYQDEKTGMFFQVPDKPDFPGNYPETSGSAMAAYACLKGARLGILDHGYGDQGSRILEGIRKTYLRQGPDGLHLYGICASAGLGAGPDPHNRKDRTGKPEYYISEAQMRDNQHGAAACMMAVGEQIRKRTTR